MNNYGLSDKLAERAKKIKLLLMDCDGVLTNGKLYFSKDGEELKTFHVHDGQGIKLWHQAGFQTGIITARESQILARRANELNIDYLVQGSKNKIIDFENILRECGIEADKVAYIGDDMSDLALLGEVGFPVLVGDSPISLSEIVHYRTSKNGGFGAVREVADLLLQFIGEN